MAHLSSIELYDNLRKAPDDDARAKIISQAFEALEERYPDLAHVATKQNLTETELRLQKEIEEVRLEIKNVESRLQQEIEKVRLEIKNVESRLQQEIEKVRLEIKNVELNLVKEIQLQSRRTLAYITLILGVMLGGLRLMDMLFH